MGATLDFLGTFSKVVDPPCSLRGLRWVVAAQPGGVILESTASGGPWGRYSVFAARPIRTIRVLAGDGNDPFAVMSEAFQGFMEHSRPRLCLPHVEEGGDAPFQGGWFGYLAYEAGRFVEPRGGWVDRRLAMPIAQWGLYSSALVCDHQQGEWRVIGFEAESRGANEHVEWWSRILAASRAPPARSASEGARPPSAVCGLSCPTNEMQWNESRDDYLRKVERILEYIRAGDVFQVNLARRLRAAWNQPPIALYDRLCSVNTATHAAYLGIDEPHESPGQACPGLSRAIVSASPELFLQVRGRDVTTRPIKGTRPRTGDPIADEAALRELAGSEKDRAELNMIIDLERNDLGRVCEFGSVVVENAGEVEALPTVFHRTATVRGRLREGCGAVDLLRATFPGGSITGAPKVRAMQIIQELEGLARGPYCGAIGWIGLNGDMALSLAIRTMAVHEGFVDLCVGSGIVAESSPQEEYAELEAKAAGMMRALKRQNVKTPKRQNVESSKDRNGRVHSTEAASHG